MSFLQTIIKSFTDKAFYIRTANDSFGKRLKYLFLLVLLATLLGSTKMIFDAWRWLDQDAPKLVKEVQYEIDRLYPADLEMTLDKGILTTNQSGPLIYTPRVYASEMSSDKNAPQHLLVLDTKAQGEDVETCSCVILVTSKGIHVRSSNKIEYRPFSEFSSKSSEPVSVNKKSYDSFVATFRNYISVSSLRYLVIGFVLFIVIVGPLSVFFGWMITLLIWSLFGLLVANVIKRPQSYGYIYKMSMYLVTPFILFDLVSGLVGFVGLGGWMTIILYMIGIAVFIPASAAAHVTPSPEVKSA